MNKLIHGVIFLVVILSYGPGMACNRTDPLFSIERSKNGNIVHYDACLMSDSKLSGPDPVTVYWVMENGQREDLTYFEKRYAYGIRSEEKPKNGPVEISLAAFGRKMLMTKIDGSYRVIVSIKGQKSILEKIYVKSGPGLQVVYADFIGRTLATGASIVERVEGNARN